MNPTLAPAAPRRFAPRLVALAAVALTRIYLPTLGTPFDFVDDGNLVYSAPPMPAADRLHLAWDKVVANYDHLGPFRPVLWAHWELAAELFRGDPGRWRLARLSWCSLAAAALLLLLRELRVRPAAALFIAALAFWNPYRNEIWTSLTLSEGVAMPYALAALWCAARANRRGRAWPWDVVSAVGVLMALGCKNTFAALVPAQVYLRLYADGATWRGGLRRHWKPAALLTQTLLLPAAHYAYYRVHWHPGQYEPGGPTLAQLGRLLRSAAGAESVEFVGAGVVLALAGLWVARRAGVRPIAPFTTPLLAGAVLLAAGLAAYLPLPSVSGRYTMPGVWGLDLILAGVLSGLEAAPAAWRRAAWVGLIGGLAVVAVANVGRQDKFAARAAVLWDALESVEQTAGPGERVAWHGGPALNVEEGIHFRWHLLARGHDVPVELYDEDGRPAARCELPPATGTATLAVTGTPAPPPGRPWQLRQSFHRPYWGGRRGYDCYLWAAARK